MCRLEPQTPNFTINREPQTPNYAMAGEGTKEEELSLLDGSLLLHRNTAKTKKKVRPKAFVVDIRPNEEFRLGHVPHSINIPHDAAFLPDGSLVPSQGASALMAVPHGRIVCVVGNKGEAAPIVSGRG